MNTYDPSFPFTMDEAWFRKHIEYTASPAERGVLRGWYGRNLQDILDLNNSWRREKYTLWGTMTAIGLGVLALWIAIFTGGTLSEVFAGVGLFLTAASVPVGLVLLDHIRRMSELHVQHFINLNAINTVYRIGQVRLDLELEREITR